MKHHIIFKFLAVFLCAASLLGAVGSGLGLFAMTELGLREKTLEEAYQDSQYSTAEALANELAVRYASRELGGADDGLINQYYGSHWMNSTFDWDQVGYVIRDEAGNALEDHVPEFASESAVFEIPTGGSWYVNVLNKMTQDEYEEKYNPVTEPPMTMPPEVDVESHVYNAVPEDGCDIDRIQVSYADGSRGEYGSFGGEHIGRVMWFKDEKLRLDFYHFEHSNAARNLISDFQNGIPVVSIVMLDSDGNVMLDASDPAGLLEEFCEEPAYFILRPLEETPLDMGSIYDAIPPEGQYVSTLYVKYADGYEESVGGSPDIGFLGYDEKGFVVFTASDPGLLDWRSERPVHISFSDEMGNQIYGATDAHGVGQFVLENDTLIFRSGESTGMEFLPLEQETEIYVYDDVPPRGYSVYEMDLWLEGSSKMLTITGADDPLGQVDHDGAGNVIFTARDWKDFVFSKPAQVRYILMSDLDGRVLYEAYQQGARVGEGEPIGYFAYNEKGDLEFSRITDTVAAAAAMAEASETTPVNTGKQIEEATNVRLAPSLNSTVVEILEPGVFVEILDTQVLMGQEWGKVGGGWILLSEEQVPEATEESQLTDESEAVDPTEEPAEATEATETPETEVTEPVMAEESVPATEPTYAVETFAETEPVVVPTEPNPYARAAEEDSLPVFGYYDSTIGEEVVVEYTYEPTPAYTVVIMMGPGALRSQYEWVLLELIYRMGDFLIPVLIASLVLFAMTAVYLCCAAGKKPGATEIRAGGLNCIPIDLYLVAAVGGVILCILGVVEGGNYLLLRDLQTGMLFSGLMACAGSLLIVGFCFAFAAQVKTPGGYWWHNSICGRSLKLIAWLWRKFVAFCGWLWKFTDEKLEPLMVRLFKAIWKLTKFFWFQLKRTVIWLCRKLIQSCDWLGRVLGRFLSMLPLTWQFLLIGFSLVGFLYIMIHTYKVGWILIGFGVIFGVILYAASAFGILLENAKRMRKGDLDTKVDDKLLIGSFRDFAEELNGLADVAVVAAQKQLKSERMKTELITNVSHDIKTPLTSIINYVDLMEKPHSPEEQAAYLEVLSRQSQRLKKLIDDLMEMSKASTGNMAVDITRVNAGEAVNQALGEFADKLEKAQLIPVFRQPEKEIDMMADGRLVWRVLSNVLSNAVKYALPGTRVYIDLMELEGKVVLSLKNISREPLNVSAEDLMERFVRGDSARNTEGSGLGLNIAQSLMELQKGKLELLVDGDLFKVTLIFPGL